MYKDKAFRLAYLISGSYADSEDIVQEAFVTCYVNRKQLKEPAYFSKWLCQIITRAAWRYCKKRRTLYLLFAMAVKVIDEEE